MTFECKVCYKAFGRKGQLNMKTVHEERKDFKFIKFVINHLDIKEP